MPGGFLTFRATAAAAGFHFLHEDDAPTSYVYRLLYRSWGRPILQQLPSALRAVAGGFRCPVRTHCVLADDRSKTYDISSDRDDEQVMRHGAPRSRPTRETRKSHVASLQLKSSSAPVP